MLIHLMQPREIFNEIVYQKKELVELMNVKI